MTLDSTPAPKPAEPRPLDRAALEARLVAAVAASTDKYRGLNYDWMVMHIRLIHCDAICVAHLAEKGCVRDVRSRHAAMIAAGEDLLRSLLRAILSFFTEFADPLECSMWLQIDSVRESVRRPVFIDAARAAGLPLVMADLDYALVPRDDRENEVFSELVRHALLAMVQ